MKRTIVQLAIILSGSLLMGALYNQFNTDAVSVFPEPENSPSLGTRSPLSAKEILSKGSGTLTLPEALVLFEDKAAVFIDARPPSFYQVEHIKDAVSVYYKTAGLNPLLDKLAKNDPYVVYCKGPNCNQAQLLIGTMQKAGFTKLFLYPGGIQEWRLARYPMGGKSAEVNHVE